MKNKKLGCPYSGENRNILVIDASKPLPKLPIKIHYNCRCRIVNVEE